MSDDDPTTAADGGDEPTTAADGGGEPTTAADGGGEPTTAADGGGDVDATADEILDDLFAVVEDRKRELPEDSYTASLFTHEKGENAVLEKLGEETTELVLAAKDDDREEITHESADIIYHLLVLLAMKDVPLSALREELADRR